MEVTGEGNVTSYGGLISQEIKTNHQGIGKRSRQNGGGFVPSRQRTLHAEGIRKD